MCEAGVIRDARLAWQIASYSAFAFHDPKQMPEDPAKPKPEPGGPSDVAYIKAHLTALAARSKHGN